MAAKKRAKVAVEGVCRLCEQSSQLQSSHILSELLHKPTYDENHRAHIVSLIQMDKRDAFKGLRERLLCDSCEKFLSREYEDYFAREWAARRPAMVSEPVHVVSGFDYRRFLLFFLTNLWRASVTTRREFVEGKLRGQEENIRKLLLGESQESLERYRVYAQVLVSSDDHVFEQMIRFPQRRTDERDVDHMLIAGGVWWNISRLQDDEPESGLPAGCLRPDGQLVLFRLPYLECPLVGGAVPLFKEIAARDRRR